jgi:hypothetical protein
MVYSVKMASLRHGSTLGYRGTLPSEVDRQVHRQLAVDLAVRFGGPQVIDLETLATQSSLSTAKWRLDLAVHKSLRFSYLCQKCHVHRQLAKPLGWCDPKKRPF